MIGEAFQRLGLVAALTFAAPVFAQTSPSGPVVQIAPAPLPGNNVRCVFEYMSAEDRELALLLMAREIVDGGRFRKASKNVQSVDRLIEEAHQKCLDRFNWSIGRSDASTGYALTAILSEALSQALDGFGKPMAPIIDYYTVNRASLVGKSNLSQSQQDRFTGYLKDNGWEEAESAELEIAKLYLETMLLKDQAQRQFNFFGGTGRQPSRRPPIRAGKAKRGKP
ncbi:MAG: hypothetical protein ABL912_07285 [Novosphingobium sp.]|mgnify:CR=1 FL=1